VIWLYFCVLCIIINLCSMEKFDASQAESVKCLIIGSGPAGFTAAVYAARSNLFPVVYEGIEPGGQLTTTTEIDNFPGYPEGVAGVTMMEDLRNQSLRFGTEVRSGFVTEVDFSQRPFKVVVDESHSLLAQTVIIATGATARYLGLPSEEKFRGSGVSACATCDGFFYRGKEVAVVGGGDTACEEASYLAGLCSKVYMIVRRDVLRASKAMQHRVMSNPKIEILFERQTKEVLGDFKGVNGVLLVDKQGNESTIKVDGFFLAIGHTPNSGVFKPWIETDANGYIRTLPNSTKTNVEGVFACGDVMDPTYRQAVTAAGSGCKAAIDAERFLSDL
jgi:thioredoxin reductase (NADPH)